MWCLPNAIYQQTPSRGWIMGWLDDGMGTNHIRWLFSGILGAVTLWLLVNLSVFWLPDRLISWDISDRMFWFSERFFERKILHFPNISGSISQFSMDISLPILAFYHRVCSHDAYIPEGYIIRSNTRISKSDPVSAHWEFFTACYYYI